MILIQYICVLAAAAILGNWYLTEYRKAKRMNKPWYQCFFCLPGLLIACFILLLPVIIRAI